MYIEPCTTHKIEETWQSPEMVGFYTETSIPTAPVQSSEESRASIKKVVCSPDLPISDQIVNIQCEICQKMYNSKAAFQAHQRTHLSKDTEDPYRCNFCSKTFAVPARLTRHYRTHTGEKPFSCEFCDKRFSVKENLSVHRRIHTKERPYKCEVCSRAFEHSGKLHRHMRIHTGERPHKCTVCAKTFIQSGQLVIHMRTHTGEKPYVCHVCQKGFTCSKQLKVHSRTHTGEKPYSCEICGKSFGYNHVLKLHQVSHYGEKVYKCTLCNDTFTSKKSMEAHIKSHSDNPPPPTAPTPPASSTSSDSSCSSTSDKENKDSIPIVLSQDATMNYLIYPRDRLSPVYLAPSFASSGMELLATAAAERKNQTLRHQAYYPSTPTVQYAPFASVNALKSVEEVLGAEEIPSEEDPLTPPSSNPVSPSSSPDPELSLPPRKRSRMILRSMEETIDLSPVRYNSVIHYARAS